VEFESSRGSTCVCLRIGLPNSFLARANRRIVSYLAAARRSTGGKCGLSFRSLVDVGHQCAGVVSRASTRSFRVAPSIHAIAQPQRKRGRSRVLKRRGACPTSHT
jgi:hypothetical protein